MEITLNWKTEEILTEKLLDLARQRGQSPEEIVTEAVRLYIEIQPRETTNINSDPLVGLFAGSPDLSANCKDILQQEITEKSGWTWKEIQ